MADIFALRDSSLNGFLFSSVGVQTDGNGLTILSLLARLGKDPWVEAAAWARKPKDVAIRSLSSGISQMPLNQQAFDDAHQTASRLIDLLQRPGAKAEALLPAALASVPDSALRVMFYALVVMAFGCWLTWPL